MKFKLLLIVAVSIAGYFFLRSEKFHEVQERLRTSAALYKLKKPELTKPKIEETKGETMLEGPIEKHQKSGDQKPVKDFQIDIQTIDENNWYVVNKDTDLVCFNLSFTHAGTAHEETLGTVTILTDMMKEGAGELDSKAFKEYLLNNQIQFFVHADIDNISLSVRTTTENFDNALNVIKMVVTALKLNDADLERIKTQHVNDLAQAKHDPASIAKEKMNLFAYKKHKAFHTIDEEVESVNKLTAQNLKDHIANFLTHDQLQTVFVGNITKEKVEEALKAIRSYLPEKRKDVVTPAIEFDNQGKVEYVKMNIPQSVMLFVMPSIDRLNPDYIALSIFNNVFGGTCFNSRLWHEVRQSKGLAYYVGSYLTNSSLVNTLKGSTATQTNKVDEVIKIIRTELKKLIDKGITKEDLEFQKKYSIGSFATDFDSILDTTQKLAAYLSFKLPPEYINKRNSIIRNLTIEEINNAGKKHLNPDLLTFIVVGRHD